MSQFADLLQIWKNKLLTKVVPPYTGFYVNVKAFLGGPYSTSTHNMSTAALNINGYLPTSQPYNTAPWNYAGTETVDASIFTNNPNIVDWVLLELRTNISYTTSNGNYLQITSVADVSNSLNGKYFILPSTVNLYCIYYSTGTGVDPAIPGTISVKVTISTNATNSAVASATTTAINAISESGLAFTSINTGANIGILLNNIGVFISPATIGNSGFLNLTQGYKYFSTAPIAQKACFLTINGQIVDLDGVGSNVNFPTLATTGNYYVTIRHRNHLAIMTSVTVNGNATLYDFTTGLSQYYGGDAKLLETGVYGSYPGDANATGTIESVNMGTTDAEIALAQTGNMGYSSGDFDLSGIVNSTDRNTVTSNARKQSQVPN